MARRAAKQHVTMKDVAEHAGVSQTTVSFIINEVPHMNFSEETHARVREAIQQLKYRPNALARGLRAQRTQTLGFISDEVASSPFAGHILAGAQATAWAHEKLLLLVNTSRNRTRVEAAVEMLLERQVEGIIFATMTHRVANPPAALYEVPAVLLDCYVEDGSLPSVVPDEVQGSRTVTEFLLAKGHRRIGFLNEAAPHPTAVARLEGYRQALSAYQMPFDEHLVVGEVSDTLGGYRATKVLMQRASRPTALFCFNDHMAMGTYRALHELSLSIPGDVAVVGFDNQEVIAASLYPPLTTMKLPHYEMGQWAVNYLVEQVGARGRESPLQHRLACLLVERASA